MATWLPRLGEIVEIAATTDRGRIVGTDITTNGPILFRVQRFSAGDVQTFTLAELAYIPTPSSQIEDDYEPPNPMLENVGKLVAAIESTGRKVWGLSITHPNGTTGPTHYHLTYYPTTPHALNRTTGRRIAGTSDRIWGRDVDKLLREISTFPTVAKGA